MKKMTNDRKLRFALTLMQVLCAAALVLGTCFAGFLGYTGLLALTMGLYASKTYGSLAENLSTIGGGLCGLITVIVVAVCSYIAIFRFMAMCQRLKKERAFTLANSQALGVISRVAIISAAALVIGYALTMLCLLSSPAETTNMLEHIRTFFAVSVPFDMLAFMYLGVGLVTRALRALLLRAKALQDENDLTV